MALEHEQLSKTIKTSSSSSKSIPTEIVFDILSWLPVESLLRCKSVCKSWCSLISDPYFIKYHLTLSTTNRHYAHQHLLVAHEHSLVGSTMPVVSKLKTCPLYDVLYGKNAINLLTLDYPMKNSCKRVSVVGYCNGLVCIRIGGDSLFIWNPSTRESIQLPHRSLFDDEELVSHGFGYNESSDDYKVVEITCYSGEPSDNVVMIYSLKNGNWKENGGFPHSIWLCGSNAFLNGALHWIANRDSEDSWIIVSLNLADETYGQVLLPVDNEDDCSLKLGILGDCLCVLCDYSRHWRFCVDVWVMKVYGVKSSWFKLVSIPYNLEPSCVQLEWRSDHFSVPLCVSNDGNVLMQIGWKLYVFDPKNGSALEFRKFYGCDAACTSWCKFGLDRCDEACIFVESLVSPAGHENQL